MQRVISTSLDVLSATLTLAEIDSIAGCPHSNPSHELDPNGQHLDTRWRVYSPAGDDDGIGRHLDALAVVIPVKDVVRRVKYHPHVKACFVTVGVC